VSLLLHLSDLHLALDEDDEDLGDYKTDVVPKESRQLRVRTIRQTLRALGGRLRDDGRRLDGLVISGDVTYRGAISGLQLLSGVLGELGDRLPSDPARIIVVPGNHDVAWETPPSSYVRYTGFVEVLRPLGYTLPLLEGVDILDTSTVRSSPGPVITINDDIVIIALNSADYSGVLESVPNRLLEQLDSLVLNGHATNDLLALVRRLRLHDAARISPDQLNAVAQAMDTAELPKNTVRAAVMHHHLLPISSEEEVKTFESFTNLGEIRAFLVANQFDIVLHGHKHLPRAYEDVLRDFDQQRTDMPGATRRCIVSSCGTIGLGQRGAGSEVGKLVEIETGPGRLRRAKVHTIRAVSAGGRMSANNLYVIGEFPLRRTLSAHQPLVVGGATVAAVHEQLVEIFEREPGRATNGLICHVDDPTGADTPPFTYPDVPHAENLQEWFRDLVDWWQSEDTPEGKPFTHGQRLHSWHRHVDQITEVVAELRAKNSTSRAVAILVDPLNDHSLLDGRRREFPAFCLMQFSLEGDRLKVAAVFRKQEMVYWWPINVAEIGRLQAEVARRLAPDIAVVPGAITTYAVIAVAGATVPRVAVPEIDRAIWEEFELRWQVSAAIHEERAPGRARLLERLRHMIIEWSPASAEPAPDGVPMPVQGLRAFADAIAAFRDVYAPSGLARQLVRLLRQLADINERYQDQDISDVRQYRRWREEVIPIIKEVDDACARAASP
jgi:3',5'-cyclic AMP phosphodiesterase CpdA